ncbi:MAG TPA: polysaccharide pyruvyl transferase family protein [Sphingomicrobium sp.]|nr:polysaccharide pyruvyl transferase family protein [Sphingomicrobium sp.]
MKVGVLTFHKCINYGSYWQARCMVEALRARGHDAELLDHDCRCVRRAEVRCALQPKLPERTPRHELPIYAHKTRRFIDAITALPLSKPFNLHQPDAGDKYDAIVVGSDEVWNFRHPWYGSKPIFWGDGLKTDRLVSYAASFGNHSAWDGIHPAWAKKLGRFSSISVRDQNSLHLVRNGTSREPALVVDPCLLYPEPAKMKRRSGAAYALVYGYAFPSWLKTLARRWSYAAGLRLVSVGYSNDFVHEQRIGDGPAEFAQLMSGASAVITNFFHGCVFSLLNGKPWVAAPSDYRSIKIPDLASTLGADHRLVDGDTDDRRFAELMTTPVQPWVEERISELRASSQSYLDSALA